MIENVNKFSYTIQAENPPECSTKLWARRSAWKKIFFEAKKFRNGAKNVIMSAFHLVSNFPHEFSIRIYCSQPKNYKPKSCCLANVLQTCLCAQSVNINSHFTVKLFFCSWAYTSISNISWLLRQTSVNLECLYAPIQLWTNVGIQICAVHVALRRGMFLRNI